MQEVVQGIDVDLIDELSGVIYRNLDKRALRLAYQQPDRSSRVYDYRFIILKACLSCFAQYRGDVYYFDGRVWCHLPEGVLSFALSKALVRGGVPKSDVLSSSTKLLYSACGCKPGSSDNMLPVLGVSSSVVGFLNGVWDFSDFDNPVYHSFEERMPILGILPYEYDPSAGCPKWVAFLESVLGRVEIETLQKYLGLGCVDRKSMMHKIEETLWLIGSGANGKSTIEEVVRAVYGHANISEASMSELLDKSNIARMLTMDNIDGKIFNICSEVDVSDISHGGDTFKRLCSGESQNARGIGEGIRRIRDIPYLIFSMNQRPKNKFLDYAMMRRLLFISFRATVKMSDMNRGLVSDLMDELPGIRNWMMEGYRKLVRDNYSFNVVGANDAEMIEYMIENEQTVQVYLNSASIRPTRYVGHREEKPQWALAAVIYEDYRSYCEKWAINPSSQRAFGSELTRLGFHRRRTNSGYVYSLFSDTKLPFSLDV